MISLTIPCQLELAVFMCERLPRALGVAIYIRAPQLFLKIMKKLLFLSLWLISFAALADFTQTFPSGNLGPSTTNAVPALTTNSVTGATSLEFGSAQIVPLWIFYNGSNGVNGTITLTFAPSLDNTNFVSARTNQFILPVVTSGLSNVVAVAITNNVGRYLKWTGVENTNTYSISNITVKLYQL